MTTRCITPPPRVYPDEVFRIQISLFENGEPTPWNYAVAVEAVENLWSPVYGYDVRFVVSTRGTSMYCFDEDGYNIGFPLDWLNKVLVFGYKTTEKKLRLVGDHLPISRNGTILFEVGE